MLIILALAAHEVAHLFSAVLLNIKFDKDESKYGLPPYLSVLIFVNK